jgi:hypothetical protein
MRLSEKTLELNICAQISSLWHGDVIWFGLTQKQEASLTSRSKSALAVFVLFYFFTAGHRSGYI